MKFVAIVRTPVRPEEASRVLAEASGLTLAEAKMRLAPEPPTLVGRLEGTRADALVAALRAARLAALAIDTKVPTDRDRTLAHWFAIKEANATFTDRSQDSLTVEWSDMIAIFRALRVSRTQVERTEKTKKFSLSSAALTGGLVLTKTSSRTVRSSEEATEQVILVYTRDGRAATLAESRLDFSCLGQHMQRSSTANMVELARLLREGARGAFFDERLLRLGRRPLPFLPAGESRVQTSTGTVTRTDTSSPLDVLAEVMRQAVLASLLP